MRTLSWWKRSAMGLGVIAAGFAAIASQPRPGQSAEPPQGEAPEKFLYYGSKSCEACHAASKDRPNTYQKLTGYIKFNEYTTWTQEDKHSIAYARLNGKRGQEMAKRLNLDVTEPSSGCVGCHSAGKEEIQNRQGDQFDPNEGVSCENCHGPISSWFAGHILESFRKKGTSERAKLGMVDVRVPSIQASQCLSCHIGDSASGRVVTHEMYAAGHPPLPSIEVSTFSNSIPRHWYLLDEKPPAIRKAEGFREGEREQTKLSIVGAAVALKTSMKLLADEAKAKGDTTVPGLDWPDFARFDCWSCHHDLKRESWRQARGYQASPGRPPISRWPLAIVELGIDRLERDDKSAGALRAELAGHLNAVLVEANARPFGKKVPLAKAAEDFAKWSEVLIEKLSKATYDQAVALDLLRKLVVRAQEKVADYDEARHIAWSIKILAADAGPELANLEKIKAVLARFDQGLKLELPAGRQYEIEDQIGQALQVIGDYEPSDFRGHLEELAGLLPPT